MSQSPNTPRRATGDTGFTLIEVMVALGILILVTAAIYPQVIIGIRATGVARDLTQAKGVSQSKLEQMRTMPFYVGREAGDYVDVLDTYYRNTTTPTVSPTCATSPLAALPPTTWTGYVPTTGTHCAWEPAGPMYRKVINPIQSPGLGAFAMVVTTQFLAGSTPPVAVPPLSGYTSQVAGADQPSSSQVGVTVAVFYKTGSGVRYTSTYSQIERGTAMDPLIQSQAKVTTVHVSSAARTWGDWNSDADGDPTSTSQDQPVLLADMGIVDLTGELFTGSRVVANATGAAGSTSLPSAVTGASTNLIAPVDVINASDTDSDVQLPNWCRWICFGATKADQVSATSADGLPNAGTSDTPVRSMVAAGAGRYGFWFDNGKWRNRMRLSNGQPMVSLDTSQPATMPGVKGCVVGGTGATTNSAHLTATGFLTATKSTIADPEVSACATAQSNVVRVFPTSFAPNGVIRINLARASAHCRVRTKSSNTANADYLATVQYWTGSGYSTAAPIRPSNSNDPLDAVNLNQVIDSSGATLGDYVESWSSLVSGDVTIRKTGTKAEVAVPAVITLLTGPTRSFNSGWGSTNNTDPSSAISISVGAVSCKAGDYR